LESCFARSPFESTVLKAFERLGVGKSMKAKTRPQTTPAPPVAAGIKAKGVKPG
jgi:hypothetical protein